MGSVPGGRRGDGAAVAGSADGTGNGDAADRVAAAAGELYGADPQQFTDRRKALATAARDAGDGEAARRIAALRKPTRSAWVVNSLTRADPGAAGRLASLAAGLRAAARAEDGRRLRELSAERGSLIDALTGQALTAAGVTDASAGLRDEVAATLTAALADPEVAAGLASGTLTKAAQWAGFGLPLPEPAGAEAADTEAAGTKAAEAEPAEAGPIEAEPAEAEPAEAGLAAAGGAAATAEVTRLDEARRRKERRAGEGRTARQRQAEEERRQAEETAQAAARARKTFEDAERGVASAATAAMDAVAAEDRLEREVRDLEDRLTRARAELSDARLRARRAETAERKARQTLARLPRPDGVPGS